MKNCIRIASLILSLLIPVATKAQSNVFSSRRRPGGFLW